MKAEKEYVLVRFYDNDAIEVASKFLKENNIVSKINFCYEEDEPSEVYITTEVLAQEMKDFIIKSSTDNEEIQDRVDFEKLNDFVDISRKIQIPQNFVRFVENSLGFRRIFFAEVYHVKFAQLDEVLDEVGDMYCNVLGFDEPMSNLIFKTKRLAQEYIDSCFCLPILTESSIDDSSVDDFVDIPDSVSGEFGGFSINNGCAFVGWYENGETYTIYLDETKQEEVFESVFDARDFAQKLQQSHPTSKVTIKDGTNDLVDF